MEHTPEGVNYRLFTGRHPFSRSLYRGHRLRNRGKDMPHILSAFYKGTLRSGSAGISSCACQKPYSCRKAYRKSANRSHGTARALPVRFYKPSFDKVYHRARELPGFWIILRPESRFGLWYTDITETAGVSFILRIRICSATTQTGKRCRTEIPSANAFSAVRVKSNSGYKFIHHLQTPDYIRAGAYEGGGMRVKS